MQSKVKIYLLFIIPFLLYLPILKGFFSQDEWIIFPEFFNFLNSNQITVVSSFLKPSVIHYVPLTFLFTYLSFAAFKLNYVGYALVSILGHVATVYLVYLLAKSLFKDARNAFWTAVVFAVGLAGYQATAWPIININIQGAAIFALLSLILFEKFLDGKVRNKKVLWLSLASLLISLLFKENAILFFVLYIALTIFGLKKKIKLDWELIIYLALFGAIYAGLRASMIVFFRPPNEQIVTDSQGLPTMIYNFVSFPFKSFAQTFIYGDLLWLVSRSVGGLLPKALTGGYGSTQFDNFVFKRVLEVINFAVAGLVIVLSTLAYKKSKSVEMKRPIIFGFLFIVINSLVYAFSPYTFGIVPLIESRNLYFLMIGFAVLFVANLTIMVPKKKYFYILLSVYLGLNAFFLVGRLQELAKIGAERKAILVSIKNKYPSIPAKVVFFTSSDTAYYGLPPEEKIMPFQSGFGETLLAWYGDTANFPLDLSSGRFLWEIKEQGYREVGGRGFGYFRDINLLKEAVAKYNLPRESVIAFSWNGKMSLLTDISGKVRSEIND